MDWKEAAKAVAGKARAVKTERASASPGESPGTSRYFAALAWKNAQLARAEANQAACLWRRIEETRSDPAHSKRLLYDLNRAFLHHVGLCKSHAFKARQAADNAIVAYVSSSDEPSKTYAREAVAHAVSAEAHAARFNEAP
jgi:hypothetical protein